LPEDPNRRRRFIVLAVIAMVGIAGLTWWTAQSVTSNEKQIDVNKERIKKVPTKAQLFRALVEIRKVQRRACRVVNGRFEALANLIAEQRPSPTTTAYYKDHPEELAKAQSYFDRTLKVLHPRNCLRDYPPPKLSDVSSVPPGSSRPKHRGSGPAGSGAASPAPSRRQPQAHINPPTSGGGGGRRPVRKPPASAPASPSAPTAPPPTSTTPTQPSPNLPQAPGPPPTVLDRVCSLVPPPGRIPGCP